MRRLVRIMASSSQEHNENLKPIKDEFQTEFDKYKTHVSLLVTKRNKTDIFQKADILFKMKITPNRKAENTGKRLLLMDVLSEIQVCLYEFIQKLKSYFDNSRHRVAFFSLHGSHMVSAIHFGSVDLYSDPDISNRIMQ